MSSNPMILEHYELFCDLAREQNEYTPPERLRSSMVSPSDAKGDRPGDEYNRRARWADVLEPHGWISSGGSGDVIYWRRPGKSSREGHSGTTGKCKSDLRGDLFYNFSSNGAPFEPEHAYDKFAAYAILSHDGDFSAAARKLIEEGYGKPRPTDPTQEFPRAITPEGYERGFKWASELSAPPKAEDWIWEGYLPAGGITLLSALWKAGKTTLLSHLLKACGNGGDFLGKPLRAAKVLYVSEEGERHWVRRRDSLELADHAAFYLQPFPTKPAQANWLGFLSQLRADVAQFGFNLVVFDTLAKLWPVQEENDACAVDTALMPLSEITKAGAGILLIHHLRKSGGSEYTGSRGSGALSAFPDILVELTRFDAADQKCKKRVLRAKGRYEETPDELVIELVDGRYVHLPDEIASPGAKSESGVDGMQTEEGKVLAVLAESPEPWMQCETIRDRLRARGWGLRNEDISAHLSSLYQRKQVLIRGQLRSKNNPREWSLTSRSDPGSHAGTTSGNEMNGHSDDLVPTSRSHPQLWGGTRGNEIE